jgi:hypothetical protein
MAGKNSGQFYVERRDDAKYTGRRGGASRASVVQSTQKEVIERVREIAPDAPVHVERVRHTTGGKPDKWRKP